MDKDVVSGYFTWLSSSLRGNFGDSWYYTIPVTQEFQKTIWYSFALGLVVFILETLIAIPLGVVAARKQYSMGLVGESGCGKSTIGRTILRLQEKTAGEVFFNGQDIFKLSEAELRKMRPQIQIIFQDPYSSLSPRLPVGEIIGEAAREHGIVPPEEFDDYITRIMDREAGSGPKYDAHVDLVPLLGGPDAKGRLAALVAEAADAREDELAGSDLFLYNRQPGVFLGAADEYIASPRLDDLACVYGCLRGFLAAADGESVPVFCVFDNEEVGSGTKQGAASTFLPDLLHRICACAGKTDEQYRM